MLRKRQHADRVEIETHTADGGIRIVDRPICRIVIAPVAGPLFNEYLLAFEVTSVLLLAAVVGAVVLGKRRGSADAR